MRRLAAPLALIATLGAGACASDPVIADDQVDDALAEPYAEAEPTPLEEVLVEGSVFDDATSDALTACMVAAGFDRFTATPAAAGPTTTRGDGLSVEEYAATWGYGISTVLGEDGARRADAPSFAAPEGTGAAGWADYRATLEPERQVAFDAALYGDGDGADPGCVAAALSRSGGSAEDRRRLDGLLRDLNRRIDDDPDMVGAAERYSSCLDEAGYPAIDTPTDALAEVGRRTEQVFGAAVDPALEVPGAEDGQSPVVGVDDVAGGTDDGSEGIETTPVTVGQLEPGALAAVQAYERELAVAELECRVRHELEVATVTDRYEREFVEQHGELLDRVR